MISSILVKGFQSHKETILDLHEGVNVLVGLTGAGKSVIFKAFDWVFRNRPLGDEYRSWWGGDTKVAILLKEGQRVGRVRTDNDNYYFINDKEFRAFGNGPPPQPVLDFLNLSDVNFQAQSDPSFLISNSSGEVARYLNRAVHLDVIDQALGNIGGTLRKEKEDLKRERGSLEDDRAKLADYDWLEEADKRTTLLEALQGSVFSLQSQRRGLLGISAEYEKTEKELVGLDKILSFSFAIGRLIHLNGEIEKQNREWEQLAGIVDQHEKAEKELVGLLPLEGMGMEVKRLLGLAEKIKVDQVRYNSLDQIVELYEETERVVDSYSWIPEAEKKLDELEELAFDVKSLKIIRERIDNVILNIEETSIALKQAEASQKKLQEEFGKLMPNRCPLCEQEVRK